MNGKFDLGQGYHSRIITANAPRDEWWRITNAGPASIEVTNQAGNPQGERAANLILEAGQSVDVWMTGAGVQIHQGNRATGEYSRSQ